MALELSGPGIEVWTVGAVGSFGNNELWAEPELAGPVAAAVADAYRRLVLGRPMAKVEGRRRPDNRVSNVIAGKATKRK